MESQGSVDTIRKMVNCRFDNEMADGLSPSCHEKSKNVKTRFLTQSVCFQY